jgi:hypothetical protein
MPVIPATQEVEVRRIMVLGQSSQKDEYLISTNKSWTWWCMPVILLHGKHK